MAQQAQSTNANNKAIVNKAYGFAYGVEAILLADLMAGTLPERLRWHFSETIFVCA